MIERGADCRLYVKVPMRVPYAAALLTAGCGALDKDLEVIDLAEVKDADSSALAVMLGWMRAAGQAGRQVQYANLPPAVRALAELYAIDAILPLA